MKIRTKIISGGYDPERKYSFKKSCVTPLKSINPDENGVKISTKCPSGSRIFYDSSLSVPDSWTGDINNCNSDLTLGNCP